ncbi:hypothetical protein [Nocardia wallacei]|uniref:hypothetical protein n=1 Tax=Nocardia wallacei TaxID=480035 RepID=UPI002454F1EE|nr:hypothetical protein [Nocardia wallacei]
MLQFIALTGITAALIVMAVIAVYAPERPPRFTPSSSLIHPPESEMDVSVWPQGWPHEAPDEPMTITEAHWTMQRHRSCDRGECPRKSMAYQLLVEAGRIRPDSGRV